MTAIMSEEKKVLKTNFSSEDSLLLVELMGQPSVTHPKLTNHKLLKHKFTSGISSQTKKEMWAKVAEEFNSSATINRTADKLVKKWINLTAKHRLLYSDVQRERELTGGGPCPKPLDTLTERVMDVIGRESAGVRGIHTPVLDTSFTALQALKDRKTEMPKEEISLSDILLPTETMPTYRPFSSFTSTLSTDTSTSTPTPTTSSTWISSASSSSSASTDQTLEVMTLEQLKKRKLILQIKYLEKKLKL